MTQWTKELSRFLNRKRSEVVSSAGVIYAIAQLVERISLKDEVDGSNPSCVILNFKTIWSFKMSSKLEFKDVIYNIALFTLVWVGLDYVSGKLSANTADECWAAATMAFMIYLR